MGERKKSLRYRVFSSFLVLLILSLLVLSGPADAFTFNIAVSNARPNRGQNVEFDLEVEINHDEMLPITEITFNLTGPTSLSCTFNTEGTAIRGCSGMTINRTDNPGKGYGHGYGYWKGNKYGFSHGYGFGRGKFKFVVTLDTSALEEGEYTTDLEVDVQGNKFSERGENVTIIGSASGNGGSQNNGGGDDLGTPRGPRCQGSWICTEWSICSEDGMQTRTCDRSPKYCAAGVKPETSRVCEIEPENVEGESENPGEIVLDQRGGNRPFISRITGAVIGGAGDILSSSSGIATIIVIILLVGGLVLLFLLRRAKRVKRRMIYWEP